MLIMWEGFNMAKVAIGRLTLLITAVIGWGLSAMLKHAAQYRHINKHMVTDVQ